jgi:tight adherence protein C
MNSLLVSALLAFSFFFLFLAAMEKARKVERQDIKKSLSRLYGERRLKKLDRDLKLCGGVKFFGFILKDGADLLIFRFLSTMLALIIFSFIEVYNRQWFLVPLLTTLVWLFPGFLLKQKLNRIKERSLAELPGVVDMLAVAMEAGLTFDSAIKYLIENTKGQIRDLFAQAVAETDLGAGRKEAFMRAAQKSLAEETRLLMRMIFHSERQGNPVKDILFDLANSIRIREKHRIQAKANRLNTTMIFPVLIFMVPPVILIYILPALLNLKYLM